VVDHYKICRNANRIIDKMYDDERTFPEILLQVSTETGVGETFVRKRIELLDKVHALAARKIEEGKDATV
jgi:hypothetical protein